ncbi:MAG: ABC transporter permease [Acidobacteria bacterium]|nr:ABC transporter permease [Acidobacteriota bacterium]
MARQEPTLYWSIIHAEKPKRILSGWPVLGEASKLAISSIWANKLRSLLTLIGVIIGVASVMVVGAFINGFESYVTSNITDLLGSNTFMVSRIMGPNMTLEEFREKQRRNKKVLLEEYQAISGQTEYTAEVVAEIGTRSDIYYQNREFYEASLSGSTSNVIQISNFDVESGRFFMPFEEERSRPVCVLGWGIAQELFPDVDPINKDVKIRSQYFRVVGVLERRGSFMGQSLDDEVYIPITTYHKMFGHNLNITMRVKALTAGVMDAAQDEIRMLMRILRHLKPAQEDTFDIMSTEQLNESVGQFTGAIATVVMPVTALALVVGGIVIMNIMLVSVTERTREIGIRKAIGAKRRDLILQFLIEASFLGFVGGLIGVFLSYSVCFLLSSLIGFTLTITAEYIFLSLTVSGVIGIVSGMYPAIKAANLDPIIALTTEN